MSKQNLTNDTDYIYCSEDNCDGKVVLASEYLRTVEPDPEPYKADEVIDIPPIAVDTYVNCHVCEDCGAVQDSWFDDYSPRPEAAPDMIEALITAYKSMKNLEEQQNLFIPAKTD